MSGLDSMQRFRAIAARLIERADADAAWFSERLQEYESGARAGLTIAQAFHLTPAPGERTWWQAEALARRDELLRTIRVAHFPGYRVRPAAVAIAQAIARYEATGWKRDRAFIVPPEGLAGDLFRLLKLGEPLSATTIRRALAHEVGAIREPQTA